MELLLVSSGSLCLSQRFVHGSTWAIQIPLLKSLSIRRVMLPIRTVCLRKWLTEWCGQYVHIYTAVVFILRAIYVSAVELDWNLQSGPICSDHIISESCSETWLLFLSDQKIITVVDLYLRWQYVRRTSALYCPYRLWERRHACMHARRSS
jgi:hypothetical protein